MGSPSLTVPMDRNLMRGVLAVLAGFLTMAVLVAVLTLLAAAATGASGDELPASYLLLNILGSALSAFAGGWVTGRVARDAAWPGWVLVGAIVVLGIPGVVGGPAVGQPVWYPLAIVLVGGIGAAIGGQIRRERPHADPLDELMP